MSPFLFLLVLEGLVGLIKNSIQLDEFQAFKVYENLYFEMLQFIDDTLILGEGCLKNLWSIKAILCGFELVLRLGVNFFKRKIIGINLIESFV